MPASRSARPDVKPKPPRRWPLILVGVLAVAAALAAASVFMLPASVISHFLPAQVQAEDFSGSLLHGAAGRLVVNARDAGAIEWQMRPLSLLRLTPKADIHWVKVGFVIDGTVQFSGGAVTGHDIRGSGAIEDLHDLGVAWGWSGTAHLTMAEFKGDLRRLDSAVGTLEVAHLAAAQIADGSDLGSYVLKLGPGAIAADGSITADLNDTGGPLETQAQIHYAPATHTGMLSGTLKERAEASPALRTQLSSLSQLRPRDAAGRFPVDLEFTL
jgi:hypothetical protein